MAVATALAVLAALSLLSSSLLTWAWVRLAKDHRWLDLPGERRLHSQPTPRGGGIGISLVALATLSWLALVDPDLQRAWWLSALGLLVCAVAGLLDDLARLSTAGKLSLQALAALMLAMAWMPAGPGHVPLLAALGIIGFVLVWVNFCNFMDGSDGLLSLQAILVAAGLAVFGGLPFALLALAVAVVASTLGFLPFNFPGARVFLGDVGSHAIGYCLALLVVTAWTEAGLSGAQLAVVLSAIFVDAGCTLASRIWRRERFWQAHAEHLYQLALRRGLSRQGIALGYGAWTLAALLLASLLAGSAPRQQWLAALSVFALALFLWLVLRLRWCDRAQGARA